MNFKLVEKLLMKLVAINLSKGTVFIDKEEDTLNIRLYHSKWNESSKCDLNIDLYLYDTKQIDAAINYLDRIIEHIK